MRHRRRDLSPPACEDVAGHRVGLFGIDMLRDRLIRRQPVCLRRFADVILFLRAEKGAKLHREHLRAAIMTGDGFGADFVGGVVDFDRVEHLRGIEKGVEHARTFVRSVVLRDMNHCVEFDEGSAARQTFPRLPCVPSFVSSS